MAPTCAPAILGSSSWPELRYDESLDGPGYFIRDGFLVYHGDIGGVVRLDRAKVYDVGGSDDGTDDAVGPHEDADNATGSDATGDAFDSSGADSGPGADGSDEGAGHADGSDEGADPAGGSDDDVVVAEVGLHTSADITAPSVSAPAPDLPSPLVGFLARVLAPGSELVSALDLPGLLAAVLARLIALEPHVSSLPPQPAVAA